MTERVNKKFSEIDAKTKDMSQKTSDLREYFDDRMQKLRKTVDDLEEVWDDMKEKQRHLDSEEDDSEQLDNMASSANLSSVASIEHIKPQQPVFGDSSTFLETKTVTPIIQEAAKPTEPVPELISPTKSKMKSVISAKLKLDLNMEMMLQSLTRTQEEHNT